MMHHNTHMMINRIVTKAGRLGRHRMFNNNGTPRDIFGHLAKHLHGANARYYTVPDIVAELKISGSIGGISRSLVSANDSGEQKNVKRPVLRALRKMCKTCSNDSTRSKRS